MQGNRNYFNDKIQLTLSRMEVEHLLLMMRNTIEYIASSTNGNMGDLFAIEIVSKKLYRPFLENDKNTAKRTFRKVELIWMFNYLQKQYTLHPLAINFQNQIGKYVL